MRKIYTKMIEKAADDGIDSWAFWGMTPRQSKCEINAFNSRIRQKMEYADTMSWMIGNYVGQAQHNPKKYPKKPNMVTMRKNDNCILLRNTPCRNIKSNFAEQADYNWRERH